MIILENNTAADHFEIILLFGAGLIGQSILQAICRSGDYAGRYFPFHWQDLSKRQADSASISAYLKQRLPEASGERARSRSIAFVWSAGKAGFNATDSDCSNETAGFADVLELAQTTAEDFPGARPVFHLLSSAGGLFEGQKLVNHHSIPRPKRFYGTLKAMQEEMLRQASGRILKRVYRPTSVFGFVGSRFRQGLIPTLIVNGLNNNISRIYGSFNTLRDYVFSSDIGAFLAKRILNSDSGEAEQRYFLGSGKPSSIYEIRHFVEQLIARKIYLRCEMAPTVENASDITLGSAALPSEWAPTDLKTAICLVYERIRAGLS